ncbi:hypothetical protein [endosymbiont GvMRE of Glomus versiforme]|uniref:hypothetical protein n=1 Tax=endosymbiont GvMRE of Glomus versiforme TaxID=2039283 RepID=UPI000EC5C11E|nr:hypothetical protein [endosymbiont GvMRE of Glomus versiforme]RHZ35183.1 hypothetical protein GvMRE_IIg50 [endosymbiont GvMRE of Glomus versiforme]
MESKQVLSVKINTQLYQQLKTQIGKGKISEFVERTLTEKLEQKDQEPEIAYKEIARDKKRWKLTKEWEKAALSDLKKKVK